MPAPVVDACCSCWVSSAKLSTQAVSAEHHCVAIVCARTSHFALVAACSISLHARPTWHQQEQNTSRTARHTRSVQLKLLRVLACSRNARTDFRRPSVLPLDSRRKLRFHANTCELQGCAATAAAAGGARRRSATTVAPLSLHHINILGAICRSDGALTSGAAAAAKGADTRQAVTVETMTKECDHSNAELLEHGCARGC